MSIFAWPRWIFQQRSIFRDERARGPSGVGRELPCDSIVRNLRAIDPDARCDAAVGNGVPECTKEHTRSLSVVIGLRHEAVRPRCCLLPTDSIDVANEKARHVLQKATTCTECRKIRVGYTGATWRRRRSEANLHVLAVTTKPSLQEMSCESRHAARRVSMVSSDNWHTPPKSRPRTKLCLTSALSRPRHANSIRHLIHQLPCGTHYSLATC